MRQVQAHELLDDPDYSGRWTVDGFYNLLVRAGYDEKTAQRAATQYGWEQMVARDRE